MDQQITIDIRQAKCELARRVFWEYLKLKDPEFYRESRPHLKEFAGILQNFWERKLKSPDGKTAKILIVNLPPRMGKSYTLTNFCSWVLGRSWVDPDRRAEKIITISYNDDMATDFSRYCRDNIIEESINPADITFSDVFQREIYNGQMERCTISRGDGGAKKWALTGEFFSYLGAGFKGQITGKGASIGIIDDPIKNRDEAYNENTLEYIWNFYKNTFRSRIESGGLRIVNHTRWRSEDLAGRILEEFGDTCYVHKRCIVENEKRRRVEVKDDNGRVLRVEEKTVGGDLLCEELCNWEDFYDFQATIDEDIFRANYFQEPLDMQGALYAPFKTYTKIPEHKGKIGCYIDTADTGDNYLCGFAYYEVGRQAYIIDALYTMDGMTQTEPETAQFLHYNKVNLANIEANNGGGGFKRNVERILRNDYNNHSCIMSGFTQSKNKITRILTHSAWCNKNIFFPAGWEKRWPKLHKALTSYQKEGKNKLDDAPDALTGVAEQFQPSGGMPIFNPRKRKKNYRSFAKWQ